MDAQVVEQEVGSTFHHWIVLLQQLLIAREEVLLPDMRRQPCATCGEHTPCGTVNWSGDTPQVGVMMSHPPFAAIHHTGCLGTRHTKVADHPQQGFLTLHEVAHHGGPVVHLSIDIDGVFRIPRSIHLIVPHTLQVSGLSTRLR